MWQTSRSGLCGITHKPSMWWFDLLAFLKDHIMPRKPLTNIPHSVASINFCHPVIAHFLHYFPPSEASKNIAENVKVEVIVELSAVEDSTDYSQDIFSVGLQIRTVHHLPVSAYQKYLKWGTMANSKIVEE
ncbi:uncharacterized protein LOC126236174 [Schistocerca nitens]|uniref:uncharacterized protein LOC126236174 n=1 Tax=Schistocerca nitens TaxID=7011 RepID=UPI00211992E9|nr:uncharacterized protein LOC126236174 [Schistocerca nitens]